MKLVNHGKEDLWLPLSVTWRMALTDDQKKKDWDKEIGEAINDGIIQLFELYLR